MIYYNKGNLKFDGSYATILADISTVLHALTLQTSKDTGKSYLEVLEWLATNIIAPMLELHEEVKGEDGENNDG